MSNECVYVQVSRRWSKLLDSTSWQVVIYYSASIRYRRFGDEKFCVQIGD